MKGDTSWATAWTRTDPAYTNAVGSLLLLPARGSQEEGQLSAFACEKEGTQLGDVILTQTN